MRASDLRRLREQGPAAPRQPGRPKEPSTVVHLRVPDPVYDVYAKIAHRQGEHLSTVMVEVLTLMSKPLSR